MNTQCGNEFTIQKPSLLSLASLIYGRNYIERNFACSQSYHSYGIFKLYKKVMSDCKLILNGNFFFFHFFIEVGFSASFYTNSLGAGDTPDIPLEDK